MERQVVPLTREGYLHLKNELDNLKNTERPKVIEEIAEARSHGDLKENAEYHAAREKQSFIEGRIGMLDDTLARANVVDLENQGLSQVKFASYVTVEDVDSGDEKTYRIVGDLEADITRNFISIQSPLAKALLGKRLDEEVEVNVPKGLVTFLVKSVSAHHP